MMTVTRTNDIPKLTHPEAMQMARTEVDKLIAQLRDLSGADWSKPTDCDRWTVDAVVAHLTGMCHDLQSMRTMFAAQKAGKAVAKELGLKNFDGWTEDQVRRYRGADGKATLAAYEKAAPLLLRRRESAGALFRQLRMPQPPYGIWTVAYMMDEILTRDVWMHRADIAKAAGRAMDLTPEHDGRFVATIVRDLARRYKKPFTLELSGPAGGGYTKGSGGETFTLDAVDFCRILSGRGDASHPLYGKVPF
jgi:uncharacterized protein (TIGR03083 family)